jgi:hypothetical protein
MFNRMRGWRLVGILAAVMLGALATAPTVAAAKPEKFVLGNPNPIVNPVGSPCAVQVNFDPIDIKRTIFFFADGTEVDKLNGYATLSNPQNGATFLHHVVATQTITYDEVANEYLVDYRGQFGIRLYPGDVGPWGVVEEPGLFLRITGRAEQTFDGDTFASTAFSFTGTYIDICAALGG